MKKHFLILFFIVFNLVVVSQGTSKTVVIDESGVTDSVIQTIKIDSVWAGHPVGFCLYTKANRQYIAYYNAERRMVVGQRNLDESKFQLTVLPATKRETHGGTSTITTWDTHNYLTMEMDAEGYIHFSGNVHAQPLTYFRTRVPYDISTLEQIYEMTGKEEKVTTYPQFLTTQKGEFLFHYRSGTSGNGNEIYNRYNCKTKKWSRLLDTPLTDGQGLMNAYQSQPIFQKDGWYHVYWVWRDTPDCSTNHDLSYMKSRDLKNWYNVYNKKLTLPATFDDKSLIVDPIPPKGGIINLAARMVLDQQNKPVFVYHKYDTAGNIQFYIAKMKKNKWTYQQITNWNYRWFFEGGGSMNVEVKIQNFKHRTDGNYEVGYWHVKYGYGTILLNNNFDPIGTVIKPTLFSQKIQLKGSFPGLLVQTIEDTDSPRNDSQIRYILKWETLNRNQDKPREKPWPEASNLYLYVVKQIVTP
jgi:hypothetical protein